MSAEKYAQFTNSEGKAAESSATSGADGQQSEMPPPYSMPSSASHLAGFQQPFPGFPGQGAGITSVTIINDGPPPPLLLNCGMGPDPMQGLCPQCGQCVVTFINYEVGKHATSLMWMFCFLGGLLCCWIPLCVPSMQDVIHSCPNCKTVLGRFNR